MPSALALTNLVQTRYRTRFYGILDPLTKHRLSQPSSECTGFSSSKIGWNLPASPKGSRNICGPSRHPNTAPYPCLDKPACFPMVPGKCSLMPRTVSSSHSSGRWCPVHPEVVDGFSLASLGGRRGTGRGGPSILEGIPSPQPSPRPTGRGRSHLRTTARPTTSGCTGSDGRWAMGD